MRIVIAIVIWFSLFPTNFGQWNRVWTNSSVNLNGVYFINKNLGWICGDSGVVLKTTNGGETWDTKTLSSYINLKAIVFKDALNGVVVGSNASIYSTTNGGESWILRWLNPALNLNAAVYIDSVRIVAVGENGLFLQSSDNGKNWNKSMLGYYSFFSAVSYSGLTFLGAYSSLFRSNNFGVNWSNQSDGDLTNSGVAILNNNEIIRNAWKPPLQHDYPPFGYIKKSTDGGISWVTKYSDSNLIKNITFFNEQVGFCLGKRRIYFTTTGGDTWVLNFELNLNPLETFNYMCLAENKYGWAVGSNGLLYKTTNGGGLINTVDQTPVPHVFSLSQNYPNPFNPTTKIKYSIPSLALRERVSEGRVRVLLKVYDILGNEITTLVNEEKSPGVYEIDLDAAKYHLASGIYFYQLRVGSFIRTNKMVLMR